LDIVLQVTASTINVLAWVFKKWDIAMHATHIYLIDLDV